MNVATELPRLVHTRPIELVTAASLGDHDPRLPPNPTTNGQPELMAGIVVDATVGLSDPQVLDALWKRYESIEQRADSLAEMAIESEQPWAMTTAHSARRDDSRSLLRVVAAHRERWDISGDAPLGPRPDESADRACNGRGGRNQPTARPTGRVSAAAHPRGMGESPCPHASRSTATSPPIPTSGSATPEPSWAHLRVASHERVKRNGEWTSTDPEYFNITVFGQTRDLHSCVVPGVGFGPKQCSHRRRRWQCACTELLGPTTSEANRDVPRDMADRQHSG